MTETIPEFLARLRRQDYQVALTPENKIRATPPAGTLPDHIRAQIQARREDMVVALQAEAFEAAWRAYRTVIAEMVVAYEVRKPRTRYWAEARQLTDLWQAHLPSKEQYHSRDTAAVQTAADSLAAEFAAYWTVWDALSDAPDGRTGEYGAKTASAT